MRVRLKSATQTACCLESMMKTSKDQLKEIQRERKAQAREARRTRAEMRERAEATEWRAFKQECVRLKK